jgi:23S rRNA G2445 N2-methylase RlmL
MSLERIIKKQIHALPQFVRLECPPGFVETVKNEADEILKSFHHAQKFTPIVKEETDCVTLEELDFAGLIELSMRLRSASQIWWRILKCRSRGKDSLRSRFAEFPWELYFSKKSKFKITTDSTASVVFHERGLKEIVEESLSKFEMESVKENWDFIIHVELHRDVLTVELALAKAGLFKRGYKESLSAAAPLREDIAFCAISSTLQTAQTYQSEKVSSPDSVLVPFAGTGTIGFESVFWMLNLPVESFQNILVVNNIVCKRSETYAFINRKIASHVEESMLKSDGFKVTFCEKESSVAEALQKNVNYFCQNSMFKNRISIEVIKSDFFDLDENQIVAETKSHLFLPLNPPFGIRLQNEKNFDRGYDKLGRKIASLAKKLTLQGKQLSGFVLCASEDHWSECLKHLAFMKTTTKHFTQGGLHIRMLQFYGASSSISPSLPSPKEMDSES